MNVQNVSRTQNGKAAFYAWQCITIQLRNREVDLVIPDDKDMDDLIEVLVEAMNTVDGNKDSAKPIQRAIETEKYRQLYLEQRQQRLGAAGSPSRPGSR